MRRESGGRQEWRAPGVLHDLGDGDALVGVGGEQAFEEVPTVLAHALGLLVVRGHDAWEQLLQPHQVVAPVIAPLREWQHRCTHTLGQLSWVSALRNPVLSASGLTVWL